MKVVRFLDSAHQVRYGSLHPDGATTLLEGTLGDEWRDTSTPTIVHKLLAPVDPPNILCIGLNYRGHAKECRQRPPRYPILFMKASTAVQNPEDPIVIPRFLPSAEVDYEGELAVVIREDCKNVSRADALRFVLGYTCANDVSARDWQKNCSGKQQCRSKTFDTFAPLGPWLVTSDEIRDPQDLRIRTIVNNEVRQDAHTSDMIFGVAELVHFLSGSTTLKAGTVILTGTPKGVGAGRRPPDFLREGDRVVVEIDRIGALRNPVCLESFDSGQAAVTAPSR